MTKPKKFGEKQERIEQTRRRQFARNSAKRIRMADRMGIPRDISMEREQRYYEQHLNASATRAEYSEEMDFVFDDSPDGGFWMLGPRKTHTEDCKMMAGKNWSWQTLRKINPMNRHAGCGCSVIPWRDGYPTGEDTMSADDIQKIRLAESKLGGSMGGQDPRKYGKIRAIVRTFGKWAGGKHSICTKRLQTEHPEICRGNCNALCAWLKDQWKGTTKWRKGGKRRRVFEMEMPPISDEGLEAFYELAKKERSLAEVVAEAAAEARERGVLTQEMSFVESDAAAGILGEGEMLEALALLDADL